MQYYTEKDKGTHKHIYIYISFICSCKRTSQKLSANNYYHCMDLQRGSFFGFRIIAIVDYYIILWDSVGQLCVASSIQDR